MYLHAASLSSAVKGNPELKVRFTLSYDDIGTNSTVAISSTIPKKEEEEEETINNTQTSETTKGRKVSFEEGYTLLLNHLEGAKLTAELLNACCDDLIGSVSVSVEEINDIEDRYLRLRAHDLVSAEKCEDPPSPGTVSFSAKLQLLSRPPASTSLTSSATKAIGSAGSSAAHAVGSAGSTAAHAVGSVGSAAFKTVGKTGKLLGVAGTNVVKSVSPSR